MPAPEIKLPAPAPVTTNSRNALEIEFMAILIFHTDNSAKGFGKGDFDDTARRWRQTTEEERKEYQERAETFFAMARHHGILTATLAPIKKLASALRAIVTVPATLAYPLELPPEE
jgi:hypothetical protein